MGALAFARVQTSLKRFACARAALLPLTFFLVPGSGGGSGGLISSFNSFRRAQCSACFALDPLCAVNSCSHMQHTVYSTLPHRIFSCNCTRGTARAGMRETSRNDLVSYLHRPMHQDLHDDEGGALQVLHALSWPPCTSRMR